MGTDVTFVWEKIRGGKARGEKRLMRKTVKTMVMPEISFAEEARKTAQRSRKMEGTPSLGGKNSSNQCRLATRERCRHF